MSTHNNLGIMDTPIIPADQVVLKKKVGRSKGRDLYYVKMRGGLHIIADDHGKAVSFGPHRCVARHLAEEFEPDLEWSELSKSDYLDVESYQHLLPKYRDLSNRLRELSK